MLLPVEMCPPCVENLWVFFLYVAGSMNHRANAVFNSWDAMLTDSPLEMMA